MRSCQTTIILAPRYVLVTGFASREGTRHSATRNTEHETEVAVSGSTSGGGFRHIRLTVPGGLVRGSMDGSHNLGAGSATHPNCTDQAPFSRALRLCAR